MKHPMHSPKYERVADGIYNDVLTALVPHQEYSGGKFDVFKFVNSESYRPKVIQYIRMTVSAPVYRVKINDNSSVDIDCYDLIENFHPHLESYYDHVDYLPTWVKEKLAVLMVIEPSKPGIASKEVMGVGSRINHNVFWIYADGDDTGGEGQEESQGDP